MPLEYLVNFAGVTGISSSLVLFCQECQEEPVEECVEQEMMVPTQEKEHKKKCLLPDDGSFGGATPASSSSARAGKAITARGVNGKIKLQTLQKLQSGQQHQQKVPQLPLDRLGAAASARHQRTFQARDIKSIYCKV